jgi:hypothetical protein
MAGQDKSGGGISIWTSGEAERAWPVTQDTLRGDAGHCTEEKISTDCVGQGGRNELRIPPLSGGSVGEPAASPSQSREEVKYVCPSCHVPTEAQYGQ